MTSQEAQYSGIWKILYTFTYSNKWNILQNEKPKQNPQTFMADRSYVF